MIVKVIAQLLLLAECTLKRFSSFSASSWLYGYFVGILGRFLFLPQTNEHLTKCLTEIIR